jgi:tol-pal system protein YbgF
MRKYHHAIGIFALALPLMAAAQVPVDDGSNGNNRGYQTPAYSASGTNAGGGASAPPSAQGQLFTQLQQMQDEIAQLRGMVEVQQNDIQRLKQESLERYQDVDSRLTSLSSGAGATTGAQNSNVGAGSSSSVDSSQQSSGASAPAGGEPADPAKEKLYYDAAFDLIKQKDFDKASQAFNAFLRRYPQSQYAGNAQYWLGEVNLAKGDLQGAGQAFAKVSQGYPNHNKVPDSLYKLADVERRLGNSDKARGILQQVVSQYPGSSAAQLAQSDLQRGR